MFQDDSFYICETEPVAAKNAFMGQTHTVLGATIKTPGLRALALVFSVTTPNTLLLP